MMTYELRPGAIAFAVLAATLCMSSAQSGPQAVDITSQAVATSALSAPSFISVAFMFGGLRSPACDVGVEVCFRDDSSGAPDIVWATISTPGGATWSLELGNGWCSYATLDAVPDAAKLTLSYSFSSSSPTAPDLAAAFYLSAPGASACASQVASPLLAPSGGPSLGPVAITMTAADANAMLTYSLSGVQSAASASFSYSGHIELAQCGTTTLSVVASQPGFLDSEAAVASYAISISRDAGITCVDVSAIPVSAIGLPKTSLSLLGGVRDASCAVVLVLRHIGQGALGSGASLAFNIVRTDGGEPLNVSVVAASGYDTTFSLGALPGSPVLQLVEAASGAVVVESLPISSTCATAAAAPVFSVPDGSSVVAPASLSVVVSSPTPGAFLYVSLDGSDPTDPAATTLLWAQDGAGASGPSVTVRLSAPGCTTLQAYAGRGDLQATRVASATYCVDGGALCDASADASIVCLVGDCSPLFYTCGVGGVASSVTAAPAGSLCVQGSVGAVPPATCPNNACYSGVPAAYTLGQGRRGACDKPLPFPVNSAATLTSTATGAPTSTASSAETSSATAAPSASASGSSSATAPATSSETATETSSATATATATASASASATSTFEPPASASLSSSATSAETATSTGTATASATSTSTGSGPSTATSTSTQTATSTATTTAPPSSSVSPTALPSPPTYAPDCTVEPNGYYCVWVGAEATFRRSQYEARLPLSPCSSSYVQCVNGASTAVLPAAAGTACNNGVFILASDPSCLVVPTGTASLTATATGTASATSSWGISPSATTTATASSSRTASRTSTATASGSRSATESRTATSPTTRSRSATGTRSATATATSTTSWSTTTATPTALSSPPPNSPDCAVEPTGYYCVWVGAEAAFRQSQFEARLPLSPCSSSYVQCVNGASTVVLPAPAGTACNNGSFVLASDPSCLAIPSATPSPGSAPSPSPGPNSCLNLDDGFYCAADAAETEARAAASASGAFVPASCFQHYFTCSAGAASPLMPVAPGTLCAGGAIVAASDPQCTAPPGPTAACPGDDGFYCGGPAVPDTSCTQSWYQCVGGLPTAAQPVAPGTACYGNVSGPGVFVAAGFGACLPADSASRCDPAVDEIVCSDFVAPGSPCGASLHRCYFGTASATWSVPAGTLCLGGSLVFDNDAACLVAVSPADAPANVTLLMNVSGLSAAGLLDPETAATVRAVLAACASGNCSDAAGAGNSSNGSSATSASDVFLNATDSGVASASPAPVPARLRSRRARRAAATAGDASAVCPRSLSSSASAGVNVLASLAGPYAPRGPARRGVRNTTRAAAGGSLGIGAARLRVTLSADSAGAAQAAAAALQAALSASDAGAASSPASSALRLAGLTVAAASQATPNVAVAASGSSGGIIAAPSRSPSPGSSSSSSASTAALGGGAIAGVVVGCVAGVAIVGAIVAAILLSRRRSAASEAEAAAAAAAAAESDRGDAAAVDVGGFAPASYAGDDNPAPPSPRAPPASSSAAASSSTPSRRNSLAAALKAGGHLGDLPVTAAAAATASTAAARGARRNSVDGAVKTVSPATLRRASVDSGAPRAAARSSPARRASAVPVVADLKGLSSAGAQTVSPPRRGSLPLPSALGGGAPPRSQQLRQQPPLPPSVRPTLYAAASAGRRGSAAPPLPPPAAQERRASGAPALLPAASGAARRASAAPAIVSVEDVDTSFN